MRFVVDNDMVGKDWRFAADPVAHGIVMCVISKATNDEIDKYGIPLELKKDINIVESSNMTITRESNRNFQQIKEFHEVFGIENSDKPNIPFDTINTEVINDDASDISKMAEWYKKRHTGVRSLRIQLLLEEVAEYLFAESKNDILGIADGLGDIGVIIDGTALIYGIPLPDVRDEIHRSNMSKLGADNKPIIREDGKIMKGSHYKEPDITSILFF